jgi:hypothetical protein
MDLLPDPEFRPKPEVMIDRFPMWQIVWDHPPRNAAAHDVENRVEDFALRVGAWSAPSRHVCFRDDRSNDFPLRVRQTAWITRHAEFLPDRGTKAQTNICLKLFFRQALSQQFLASEPDAAAIDQLLRTGFSILEDLAENLNRIPDPAVREKLLIDTVSRAARTSQRGSLMQLRGALSLYSDPVSRIVSVESYAREMSGSKGDGDAPQIIRNLCNQLAILGHSEADLLRVREAAGRYGR